MKSLSSIHYVDITILVPGINIDAELDLFGLSEIRTMDIMTLISEERYFNLLYVHT